MCWCCSGVNSVLDSSWSEGQEYEEEIKTMCKHCFANRDSHCCVVWEKYEIKVTGEEMDAEGKMEYWLITVDWEEVWNELVEEPELGAMQVRGALKAPVVRDPVEEEVVEEEVVVVEGEETGEAVEEDDFDEAEYVESLVRGLRNDGTSRE